MYPWHDCLEVIRSSMCPCWTRWRVRAWLMNSHNFLSKKSTDNPTDGTLKRVHTEVSDSTSSNEESVVKAMNAKKSIVTSFTTWPRFLIIGSTDEGALRKLSPFAIKVTPHSSLNSCKGVIRSRDLEGVSEEEICENLTSQGVVGVKRINLRRNNELVPTNTLILTFNSPTLPNSVKAGYLNIPVVPYIPNP